MRTIAAVLLVAGAAGTGRSGEFVIHGILQTGLYQCYVDTVIFTTAAAPPETVPTPAFGGEPGVEDTANLGNHHPDGAVVKFIVNGRRNPDLVIDTFRLDRWYVLFAGADPAQLLFTRPTTAGEEAGRSIQPVPAAMPNPFRCRTLLSLAPPRRVGALRIYDQAGRLVRSFARNGPAVWDGCDEARKPVPAGVYFAWFDPSRPTESLRLLKVE